MEKEKVLDIVEKAIDSAFRKGVDSAFRKGVECSINDTARHFETYEACKDEAIKFTNDNLKAVNQLLSDDYKTGYKEGIEHYLIRSNPNKTK